MSTKIKEVTVGCRIKAHHPTQQYGSLESYLEVSAVVGDGEDVAAAQKYLRNKVQEKCLEDVLNLQQQVKQGGSDE